MAGNDQKLVTKKHHFRKMFFRHSTVVKNNCHETSPLKTFFFCPQVDQENFGIDWEGPSPSEEWDGPVNLENQRVCVPETTAPLTSTDYEELVRIIDLCLHSDFHGVDVYLQTMVFVRERVNYDNMY